MAFEHLMRKHHRCPQNRGKPEEARWLIDKGEAVDRFRDDPCTKPCLIV